ncbi:serine/threonine-protein kinase 12 isoform X2 [Solanum lycopersicum]|uniref:serine/threonine-protein kinase 12 isoform X2 n=1 Tax=Solanum lycopersicum TaxID=4081 RepID=UPI000276AC44|nr:integrin-linked protein kinase 1 isoform X2 [Solanum lycopersicum]
MESKSQSRFPLGRQSSLAPEKDGVSDDSVTAGHGVDEGMDSGLRLMYMTNDGDLEGMEELLDSGTSVNYRDIDGRTALHIAACQGYADVVDFLLKNGAQVDSMDRWGSTPLADAIYYKNNDVVKLLEVHGAKPAVAPMHVENVREIPEYEIDPRELDFSNSVNITKGTYCVALWRGTKVAVKKLGEELFTDEDKVKAFGDELALVQKIRHPNVVQFLGAVTQSSPMMIVTEYLSKGDLRAFLKRKGALKPIMAVKFALDIARGINYLHENKPEAIIHRDLEPENILRDDSGLLKVADFGLSKLMKFTKTVREVRPLARQEDSWRYVAPEVLKHEEYDTKVDVFSFALILQEMIEGCPPFSTKQEIEVAKAYVANERPPFKASQKLYAHGLRKLIEDCWKEQPSKRPTFQRIIIRLEEINRILLHRRRWKAWALNFFQKLKAVLKFDHSNSKSHWSRPTF